MFTALLLLSSSLASIAGAVEWYQRGPIYQIFPMSFADSNGDGKGDLRGIAQHAKYLKDLGIEAIWLNPIGKSPFKDSGYDCSDYVDVNPDLGTLEDAEYMIKVLHDYGIKVMIDFVPNHSSDEHQWFKDSIKKINGKDDYYVWMDANGTDSNGKPIAPYNNSRMFTYNEERKQFYFHQFSSFQPDLNYRNPKVLEEMKEVLRFWMRKGIDGFRVDAAMDLWESSYEASDDMGPPGEGGGDGGTGGDGGSGGPGGNSGDGGSGAKEGGGGEEEEKKSDGPGSSNMTCQPESVQIMKEFNLVLEEDEFKDVKRANIIEIMASDDCTMLFYDGKNAPLNMGLTGRGTTTLKASTWIKAIDNWMTNMPSGSWPNWEFGNHDQGRLASRLGDEMVDSANMLLLLLPGLPMTYYGEELGMTSLASSSSKQKGQPEPGVDDGSRTAPRNPMQWNNSINAGFTSASKPYIDINSNYLTVNVASESKLNHSHLNIYKKLVALHKELSDSGNETYKTYALSDYVFALERPKHILVVNMNEDKEKVDLKNILNIPDKLYVKIPGAGYSIGDIVSTKSSIKMAKTSGVVFSYDKVEPETPSFAWRSSQNPLFIITSCITALLLSRSSLL